MKQLTKKIKKYTLFCSLDFTFTQKIKKRIFLFDWKFTFTQKIKKIAVQLFCESQIDLQIKP